MRVCAWLLLVAASDPLASALAQGRGAELRGRVLLADSATGAAGIVVVASEKSAGVVARALTGARGDYVLPLPRPARYLLRALRIGFQPTIVAPFDIAEGEVRALDIVLTGQPVSLPTLTVRGENTCRSPQDSGQLVVQFWEQARTALAATSLGDAGAPLMAKAMVYERTLDLAGTPLRAATSSELSGTTLRPFASLPADSLARVGYVTEDKSGTAYRAPDADVLLSDSFVALHCLWAEPPPPDHPEWVGIGVWPAQDRRGLSDIEGTLWLDRASSELRVFEYRYTGLPRELTPAKAGGRVEFERLPTGHWIVSRWSIRMPQTAIRQRVEGVWTYRRVEDRTVAQAIRVRGGETLDIQQNGVTLYHSEGPTFVTADSARATAALQRLASADPARVESPVFGPGTGGLVRGRVTESGDTSGVPGAQVEIVEASTLRWADKHGEFRFSGVRAGTYEFRARSLGYQPWSARVVVEDGGVYDQNIELKRLAHALTEVRIEGRPVKVPARYEDVYRRAARGWGKLITREEIERRNPLDVASLLATIPGVLVTSGGITFQRCNSPAQQQFSGPAHMGSGIQVYIDGVRMNRPPVPSNAIPNKTPSPADYLFSPIDHNGVEWVLELVPPTAIQAIEVYRGVAQIPAEFLDDACAVIAIWTKAY
jgi:hypothetical protein